MATEESKLESSATSEPTISNTTELSPISATGDSIVEPKVLSEPDVSPIEPEDQETAVRKRSLSNSTRRSGHYDSQRLEKRPSSVASRSTKGKSKRTNVDFREPTDDERYRPVSPVESDSNGRGKRPTHSREDSYTNFSRPDASRQSSTRSTKRASNNVTNNGMSSLPTHLEASSSRVEDKPADTPTEGMTALPERKETSTQQKRLSAMSASSRRLRPPIHQSDLEQGNTSSEESAPVPPFAQSVKDDGSIRHYKDLPPPPPEWLRELYTVSYLIFFSFLGTLARTGIEWLTFYPGAIIITPIVWANFAGSLFMGFLSEDSRLFHDEFAQPLTTSKADKRMSKQSRVSRRSGMSTLSQDFARFQKKEQAKIKKNVPLYIGLTTGFCGCFTSFSIFARDMFLALSNDTPSPINHPALPPAGADSISTSLSIPRNGGYSFMAILAVIITTLALSIGGFAVGEQLALMLEGITPRIPTRFTRLVLDRLVVVLGWGCWLGAIFLTIFPPDRSGGPVYSGTVETWRGIELFSMVFCPVGCLLRYWASKKMNAWEPSFPLGTFAVNMLGTAIMAVCYDIQHIGIGDSGSIGGGLLSCQALEGLVDGFTGCLTTVSTWVAEISALKRRYAWSYTLSSIIGGLCLVVVIMGPVRWTIGFSNPACVTSYQNKY